MQVIYSQGGQPRTVQAAEEAAWVEFYEGVHEPSLAAQLVDYIEASDDLQHTHAALLLKARRTLLLYQARQARNERIGQFVRAWFGLLPLFSRTVGVTRDIAVQCLPRVQTPLPQEPAIKRVRKIAAAKQAVVAQQAQYQAAVSGNAQTAQAA